MPHGENIMEQETKRQVGERLAAVHGSGRVIATAYSGGGVAFFRRPTQEEHDSYVLYMSDNPSPETKAKAARAYCRACFCEALDGSTFDQVVEKAGPVWCKGPALEDVARLSGATKQEASETF